jgi:hypothetical protein
VGCSACGKKYKSPETTAPGSKVGTVLSYPQRLRGVFITKPKKEAPVAANGPGQTEAELHAKHKKDE